MEAKLSYCGNVLIENRNGIVCGFSVAAMQYGPAERHAAMIMADCSRRRGSHYAGFADKGYGLPRTS